MTRTILRSLFNRLGNTAAKWAACLLAIACASGARGAGASLTSSGATMTPVGFRNAIAEAVTAASAESSVVYDGQGVTVDFDNAEIAPAMNHSDDGLQFYILGDQNSSPDKPVTVKNVKFSLTPGTYSYNGSAYTTIQLYLYAKNDVSFENCVFANVGLSMNGATNPAATGYFTDCTFENVDGYGLKYFRNLVATRCLFDGCKRAMFPSCSSLDASDGKYRAYGTSTIIKIDGCRFVKITKDRIIKFYNLFTDANTTLEIINNVVESSSTASFITCDFDGGLTPADYPYTFTFTGNTGVTSANLNASDTKKTLYISGNALVDVEPVAALAIARIGSTEYGSLDTLLAAIPSDGTPTTITILVDLPTENAYITLPQGYNVTIDFNGHVITSTLSGAYAPIENYGTLTLVDTSAGKTGGIAGVNRCVNNYGTLNVGAGTFDSGTKTASNVVFGGNYTTTSHSGGTAIRGANASAVMNIWDCNVNAGMYAVYNYGTANVYGGTFNGTSCSKCTDSSYAYTFSSAGTLNFYNGAVSGVHGALSVVNGTASIYDGTFTVVSCQRLVGHSETPNAGNYYALYVAGETGAVSCDVLGGTFTSPGVSVVLNGNSGDGGLKEHATLAIHGGTFVATGSSTTVFQNDNVLGDPKIYGGTFTAATAEKIAAFYESATSKGYLADDFKLGELDETTHTYIVVAKTYVAQIGTTKYETLAEAVAAVPADGTKTTIQMIADETIDGTTGVTIGTAQDIVLDLNGHTVQMAVASADERWLIKNEGSMTVKDSAENGKIFMNATGQNSTTGIRKSVVKNMGSFTVEGGTIEMAYSGTQKEEPTAVMNDASERATSFTVNGGTVVNSANRGTGVFLAVNDTFATTFDMQNGRVEGYGAAVRYYFDDNALTDAKLTFKTSGGTIYGRGMYGVHGMTTSSKDWTGISFEISGGTFGSVGLFNRKHVIVPMQGTASVSGGTFNGDVYIYGHSLNITDGNFNGAVTLHRVKESLVSASISGGRFKGAFAIAETTNENTVNPYYNSKLISGGIFSIEPSATYIATGYEPAANTDAETKDVYPYTVAAAVAQIGTTKYYTLADAFAAANDAGEAVTITMLADSELVGNIGYTVNAGSDITLDLNGHTLSQVEPVASGGYFIQNYGTLTLKDSTDVAKDGTGDGMMTTSATNPDASDSPSYANNLITNRGTLTIESGCYKSLTSDGYASYVVDNYSGGTANITGGKLTNTAPYSYVVRMFLNSTTANNGLNISGGIIEGTYAVWMQYPNGNANKATLNISGGTISATGGFAVYAGGADNRDASNIDVSFTGGTVGGSGVWLASDTAFHSLEVSGGTYAAFGASSSNEGFISGGTFESLDLFSQGGRTDFTTVFADGYVLKDNQDGTYGVKEGTYVAQILENGYVNISAPINEASDDVYIHTPDNYYFRNKTLLDANGNTCPEFLATSDETIYYYTSVSDGQQYTISAKLVFEYCYLGDDYKYQTSELFEIAPVVKAKFESLQAAIDAAQDGDTVKLLTDVTVSAFVDVNKSITLDGDGRQLTVNATRGIRVTTGDVDVTVKNLVMPKTAKMERAIQVDSGKEDVSLTIDNVTATATMYTVNVCADVVNLDLTIKDSNLTGWGVANLWGNNVTVTIENSTLTGVNDKTYNADGWNDFGVIIVEGDTTGETDTHASAYDITIKGTAIVADSTTGNKQMALVYNNPSESDAITLENCTIELKNENCSFLYDNGADSVTKLKETKLYETEDTLPTLPDGYCYVDDGEYKLVAKAVAQIGTTKYGSLAAAFAAAEDGDTVEMLEDITLAEALNVALDGKSVTLDLGGKTLAGRTNLKSGSLTIKNGTVAGGSQQALNVYGSADTTATNYSVLTIANDVTVTADVYGVCLFGETAGSSGYGAVVNIVGTISTTGDGKNGAVFVSGNLGKNVSGDAHNVINVTGKITSATDAAIAMNGLATVNVSAGAEVTGNTAIAVKRGTLNVTDGTIHATGAKNYTAAANYNGTEMTGAAISVSATYSKYGALAVNVSGGTVTSDNADPIFKQDGTYQSDATVAVSGGYFSSAVSADYCASGYLCTTVSVANGYYQVVSAATVTFALGEGAPEGAAAPEELAYPSGNPAEIALPKPTYTSTVKTFAGWKVSGEGDAISTLPAGKTGDITLVATWTGVKTVTVDAGESKTPTIKVTDDWIAQNVTNEVSKATTEEIQTALNKEEANGNKAWENYVLGLNGSDPNANVAADAAQGPVSATPITSNVDVPAVDTGFKVEYKLVSVDTNGTAVTKSALQPTPDLTADIAAMTSETNVVYYKTVAVITSTSDDSVKVEVPSTNTIGVLKVESGVKTTAVAVPWASYDGTNDISVADIVRTANLTPGDELKAYDKTADKYKGWTLSADKAWEPDLTTTSDSTTLADVADAYTVKRGSAVWLTRADPSQPIYLVGGVAATEKVSVALEPKKGDNDPSWNLVGSAGTEPVKVSEIAAATDKIVVPTAYIPKEYEYVDGKGWGYWDYKTVTKPNGRKTVEKFWKAAEDIPAGTGFWYLNGGDSKDINL